MKGNVQSSYQIQYFFMINTFLPIFLCSKADYGNFFAFWMYVLHTLHPCPTDTAKVHSTPPCSSLFRGLLTFLTFSFKDRAI